MRSNRSGLAVLAIRINVATTASRDCHPESEILAQSLDRLPGSGASGSGLGHLAPSPALRLSALRSIAHPWRRPRHRRPAGNAGAQRIGIDILPAKPARHRSGGVWPGVEHSGHPSPGSGAGTLSGHHRPHLYSDCGGLRLSAPGIGRRAGRLVRPSSEHPAIAVFSARYPIASICSTRSDFACRRP